MLSFINPFVNLDVFKNFLIFRNIRNFLFSVINFFSTLIFFYYEHKHCSGTHAKAADQLRIEALQSSDTTMVDMLLPAMDMDMTFQLVDMLLPWRICSS